MIIIIIQLNMSNKASDPGVGVPSKTTYFDKPWYN